jgi:hypothetical protein
MKNRNAIRWYMIMRTEFIKQIKLNNNRPTGSRFLDLN